MSSTMQSLLKEYCDAKALKYAKNGMGNREAIIAAKYAAESMIFDLSHYERTGGHEYAENMLKMEIEDVKKCLI